MQRTRRIFDIYARVSSSGFQTDKTRVIKTAWRGLGKASCDCKEMCEILHRSGGRQWRRAERKFLFIERTCDVQGPERRSPRQKARREQGAAERNHDS